MIFCPHLFLNKSLFVVCRSNFKVFSKDRMLRGQCHQTLTVLREGKMESAKKDTESRVFIFLATILLDSYFFTNLPQPKGPCSASWAPRRRTCGCLCFLDVYSESQSRCQVKEEAPVASAHRLTPYKM